MIYGKKLYQYLIYNLNRAFFFQTHKIKKGIKDKWKNEKPTTQNQKQLKNSEVDIFDSLVAEHL